MCTDRGGQAATPPAPTSASAPTRAAATSTDAMRSPARTDRLCDPSSGRCIETDQNLPAGSPPDCARDVPSYTDCDPRGDNELRRADPVRPGARGFGYWDYPLNGETERDEYRSWARRDLMLLIRRATAATQCLSEDWEYQAYQDLGSSAT